MTPTQRTMKELKDRGIRAAVVEKWNMHVIRPGGGRGIRQDLFGIIDILALDHSRGFVGIQVTSGNEFSSHHKKLTQEKPEECINWLKTPRGYLELWAWRKVKVKRGGKAKVWKPRIREYRLWDFLDPLTGRPLCEHSND